MKTKSYNNFTPRLHRSLIVHITMIVLILISALASTSPLPIDKPIYQNNIQRVLPADIIPTISSGNSVKTTTDGIDFSRVLIDYNNPEEYLHIHTTLEQCSSDHARTLTSVLVYTQTTSSYL